MEWHRSAFTLVPTDTKTHRRIPVDLPAGAGALRVTLTFTPWTLGDLKNLVTLSITGPRGFRGAGHRHGNAVEVLIAADHATPGYVPGEIEAGTWTVGVHTHLALTALDAEVVVETLPSPAPLPHTADTPLPALPPLQAGEWMMGDLHCHTTHSDGRWSARDLAAAALARGLRFLALTDHNTVSGRGELARNYPGVLLPGLELTTYYGHGVIIGHPEYADWTAYTQQSGMRPLSDTLWADAGAYVTIAHPFAPGDPFCTGCNWTYFDLRPGDATHLEVWNGQRSGTHNALALEHWYGLVAAGRRVVATAGTDNHGPTYRPDHGLTCTPATADPARLAAQLAAGETYLSTDAALKPSLRAGGHDIRLGGTFPGGPLDVRLEWTRPVTGTLVWVIDGRREEEPVRGLEPIERTVDVRRWLNVEVRSPDGALHTLSNPVYAGG
ncbi:hypothetical protein HNQ07_002122 [Deinococcus metalli]|uniref:Phosphoesterase n=1 Tax=Deinococcus metalli TaxID=1141878 RepID=A0A7W8KGF1_9DEIO|nr:CehA/McbA family metallohydrolase [Deinococcus metalli]MBB5376658.1 hypothetical protein [Deinococcus metalli]GHF42448.1 phosphoesterase [Deinococcus metalli]